MSTMPRPKLFLINLKRYPIWKQLEIEEALLRADDGNWCLFNEGSPEAIVMGISGKPDELIDSRVYQKIPVPVYKRFSGGGTVFVDHNTYFVTLICNETCTNVAPLPGEVLKWNANLYTSLLGSRGFSVHAQDYAIQDKKFGGNAQYLCKGRWLHHSSLLWDYNAEKMQILKMPCKIPEYRKERQHSDFLCCLKEHLASPTHLFDAIIEQLSSQFDVIESDPFLVDEIQQRPHRKSLAKLYMEH